ncbi:rCG59787 [Rattus norvegicus]|nr:rCG59787 [Rattus norvegicus]
MSWGTNK